MTMAVEVPQWKLGTQRSWHMVLVNPIQRIYVGQSLMWVNIKQDRSTSKKFIIMELICMEILCSELFDVG